jgi:FG-GAP-like repeat
LIISVSYDSSVNNAPSAFTTAFAAAVQFLENTFTNPITVNIDVGFGEIGPDNTSLGSDALGESNTFFNNYTYTQVRNALVADTTSADQVSAGNSLPVNDPTGGGSYWMSTAEAKALGLMGPSGAVDGYVGFSSSLPFTYNDSNGVASGTYDFTGVALHELTEVLGRELFVGDDGIGSNSFTPLDLFHYSSNGVRDFSGTAAGYFSPNGGTSNLDKFNTNTNGDFGDWASSAGNDSFLAFSNSGVVNAFSQADLREINVLGYDEAIAGPGASAFVGDFDGDGKSDIVWLSSGNTPTVWLMNGTTVKSATALASPPSSWRIVATGDFYGNGDSDILWQNSNAQPSIWEMNGSTIVSAVGLFTPSPQWKIVGAGDFYNNGHSDILWINTITNTPAIWEMNGTSIVSAQPLYTPTSEWKIVGTGDFNGDGYADILWVDTVTNTPAIWEMNGTSIVSAVALPAPPPSWRLAGTGDFNGDGKSDLMWQNSNGDVSIWEMNGTTIISAMDAGNPGAAWNLVGAGDFTGNGKSDLLFLDPSTSQVQIWIMNGTQIVSISGPMSASALSGAQGSAQGSATPLSASPVLAGIDTYNAGAPLAGMAAASATPALGGGPSGQGPAPTALGAAPSGGLGANGSASDPLGSTRGLLTVV